jgi:hypothetical protein
VFSAWSRDVDLEDRHDGDGLLEDLVLQQLGVRWDSCSRSFLMRQMRSVVAGPNGGSSGLVTRTGCTCTDDRGKHRKNGLPGRTAARPLVSLPHSAASSSASMSLYLSKKQADATLKAHVARICFKCFNMCCKCYILMLQK